MIDQPTRIALIIAVAAVAAATIVALFARYETGTALDGLVVRTDRLTGAILICDIEVCWDADVSGEANPYRASQPSTAGHAALEAQAAADEAIAAAQEAMGPEAR